MGDSQNLTELKRAIKREVRGSAEKRDECSPEEGSERRWPLKKKRTFRARAVALE